MARILLVDDEPDFVAAAVELLRLHGHETSTADSLERARNALTSASPDVVLLDLMLPDGNGLELLHETETLAVKKIVLMTGHPGIKSHIETLSGPTVSYLTKPIDTRELMGLLRNFDQDAFAPKQPDEEPNLHFGLLIGETPKMQAVYEQIRKVAATESAVLVVGETGTGKELVAEAIHRESGRSGEFVAVNCGSLSKDLAGSELFGHEKGSFTGAVRRHLGFFKRADGGTLFLDELTEMPTELQPHFLRVLETQKMLPVGSEREVEINVRVIAATNRDPLKAIKEKMLRKDLYYRLSVFPIKLPPLRERPADIAPLARHFLEELRAGRESVERWFSENAIRRLQAYHWPGNVRELKHVVHRAAILAEPDTQELELPDIFESPFVEEERSKGLAVGRSIRDMERELIMKTLAHFGGDKKATAEILGISLNTLYNRLHAYEQEQVADSAQTG